jgi:hypothetical protein
MASPINDKTKEMISAMEEVVNTRTFRRTPKNISRYPSVRNLSKLL